MLEPHLIASLLGEQTCLLALRTGTQLEIYNFLNNFQLYCLPEEMQCSRRHNVFMTGGGSYHFIPTFTLCDYS